MQLVAVVGHHDGDDPEDHQVGDNRRPARPVCQIGDIRESTCPEITGKTTIQHSSPTIWPKSSVTHLRRASHSTSGTTRGESSVAEVVRLTEVTHVAAGNERENVRRHGAGNRSDDDQTDEPFPFEPHEPPSPVAQQGHARILNEGARQHRGPAPEDLADFVARQSDPMASIVTAKRYFK